MSLVKRLNLNHSVSELPHFGDVLMTTVTVQHATPIPKHQPSSIDWEKEAKNKNTDVLTSGIYGDIQNGLKDIYNISSEKDVREAILRLQSNIKGCLKK